MAVFAEQREKPANAGNYPKYIGYFEGQVSQESILTPEEYVPDLSKRSRREHL